MGDVAQQKIFDNISWGHKREFLKYLGFGNKNFAQHCI
jgi:hypothetical protein